jgi:hypothetical protein
MGRNTVKNVTEHNNALHKKIKKATVKRLERKETLKSIVRKFNEQNKETDPK